MLRLAPSSRGASPMLTKDEKFNLTLTGFQTLEVQMLQCMEFIPFIANNKSAVSPKFVTIILEGCSLIDSTFRACYKMTISRHPFRTMVHHWLMGDRHG